MGVQSFRASAYLNYITHRRTIQYIHSPFLFELMKYVFDDSTQNRPDVFSEIENRRKSLAGSKEVIRFMDHGAGSNGLRGTKEIPVSEIARRSLKQARYARFLYRLAEYSKARSVVELGTSLGITTRYLSEAVENVYTIEGDRSVLNIARQNWDLRHNIHAYLFDLNEKWDLLAKNIGQTDILFIDANHRKEAMIRYYLQGSTMLHENSIVVFDDIHWNQETLEAWNILRSGREVTLSFDIFQMGFLFFDKRLSKENYTLKY